MNSKDLQIEILTSAIGGLYKDLAELKSALIITNQEKKELEEKIAEKPIEE